MSDVTNMILSFSLMEESDAIEDVGVMAPINAWLTEQGYGALSPDVDLIAGGNKHLEVPLYVAAFDTFDLAAFCAMLRTLRWIEPELVQVFVQGQEDDQFTIIRPCHPDWSART